MDINLELYKVFYFVATTLSFSQASRQLYISQSAVSQAIKTLEKKLGHTLFIRSTKKVILTAEGELLLQHVKPALEMLGEGEALLSDEKLLTGHLRIGASDTICRYFLLPYLQKFHRMRRASGKQAGGSDRVQLPQFPSYHQLPTESTL